MNALAPPLAFASAYRQLRPSEKVFVDGYVAHVEREAVQRGERISLALYRAIPQPVVDASRGMLERPMVLAAITERINEIALASELTAHRVVKEIQAVAFSNLGDYMQIGEDGQPWFDLTRCTPEQLSAVKSIEIEESGGGDGLSRPSKRKFKFVLHDKLAGLKMLADYMGLLQADNPHWRADSMRPAAPAMLPAGISTDHAADMYSQMING